MIKFYKQWPFILTVIIVLINVEQCGVIGGWISPVLIILQSNESPIPITNDQGSWIATMMSVGSVCSTPIVTLSMHYIGRKYTIILTTIPLTICWLLISFATTPAELMLARFFAGIGVSSTFMNVPVYLAEISSEKSRGMVGMSIVIINNLGTLWIYWIGTNPRLWFTALLSAIPLFIVIFFYMWLPESPYFLLSQNKRNKAEEVLKKIHSSINLDYVVSNIETQEKKNIFTEMLTTPNLRALMICMGIITIKELSGEIVFVFYTHLIFQKAGNVSINTLSMIKVVMQIISSIGAAYVIDTLGRKPLLILSCIGASFFMACEAVYFYLLNLKYNLDSVWWLPLASMILFEMFQTVGIFSITTIYFGELFHPNVKPLGVCICKAYTSLLLILVGKLFQILMDFIAIYVPFFCFSIISGLGVVFIVFIIPETKGKTLEDIQYYMKHKQYPAN